MIPARNDMTATQIKKTAWFQAFSKSCSMGAEEALQYASDSDERFTIHKTNESGVWLYVVSPQSSPAFWMTGKSTRREAVALCRSLKWKVVASK